jgi:hypothetical protein
VLRNFPGSGIPFGLSEDCPKPAALEVCRESRAHTLKQYVPLSPKNSIPKAFYFSPERDMLYLNINYMKYFPAGQRYLEHTRGRAARGVPRLQQSLRDTYQDELDKIKVVLVDHSDWLGRGLRVCMKTFSSAFGGLETIRIAFTHDDVFKTYKSEETVPVLDGQEIREHADRLRAEFAMHCTRHPEWTARKLELMDRKGRFY